LDQAFLRYQEDGVRFAPHIVVIGFMSENINRNVNVFRPFYTRSQGTPLAKPRFVIRNGNFALLPNPLPAISDYQDFLDHPEEVMKRIGQNDYFYGLLPRKGHLDFLSAVHLFKLVRETYFPKDPALRRGYYNTDAEPFQVTVHIFDAFHKQVRDNGSVPLIVIFPEYADVRRYRRNRTKIYQPLLEHFDARGYRYFDAMSAFGKRGQRDEDLFAIPHYNELGNRLIAEHLLEFLQSHDMLALPSRLRLPLFNEQQLAVRRAKAIRDIQRSAAFAKLATDAKTELLDEIRTGYERKIEASRLRN
jgi:hypothetical protein